MTMLLVLLAVLVASVHGSEYGYASNGADWTGTCADGTRQSPIDLVEADAVNAAFAVMVTDAETDNFGVLMNNGHTLVFTPNTSGLVTSTNPMVDNAAYVFAQFHFHWDDASTTTTPLGSEHTVAGVPYPLECHFVHYKEEYGGVTAAAAEPDGLMVIGQFFEVDDTAMNAELNKVLDGSAMVVESNASYAMNETVDITSLMTTDTDMMHYNGSLTTPDCNEVVSWFVLTEPMGVAQAQLDKLYALMRNESETIGRNWRMVQDLNDRTVYRNFAIAADNSTGGDGPAPAPVPGPAPGSSGGSGDDDGSPANRAAMVNTIHMVIMGCVAAFAPTLLWG